MVSPHSGQGGGSMFPTLIMASNFILRPMKSSVNGPVLVTFVGDFGQSPMASLVGIAHRAIALDLLEAALECGAFERIYLLTNSPALAAAVPAGVLVEATSEPFHFGRAFADLIARDKLVRPLYIGRGALPFLDAEALAGLAGKLAAMTQGVLTNNFFSADLVGWTPGGAIQSIDPPPFDNPFPRRLADAGLEVEVLPPDATTRFDVDTPTDLYGLALHPLTRPNARRYVDSLSLDLSMVHAAAKHFTNLSSEVVLAGRVGSAVWSYLERDSACRVRVFSEERGMKADGRLDRGEARSLLGSYFELTGAEGLFRTLAGLGDAVFLDSRVLFAHLQLDLSLEDRFRSDLGDWQMIVNPTAAGITRAAVESTVPVVLGGHSLMSGGLYVLLDAAWRERDRELGHRTVPNSAIKRT
jgi:hypothetical protein